MSRCNNGSTKSGNDTYLVACAYKPAAKFDGQRPYENGNSCSKCQNDFFCYRNQCTNDTSVLTITYAPSFD
uniref:SCP domain-containing protein n=1 Tax=Mesocestoides corti TaxID=53468 RepID=A0A5K3ERN2_MESCO